jgi:3-hydroxybutyryl-CoA dehydrogenase
MNMPYRSAAVIGTGMMGPGIAATLAIGGIPTVILSRDSERAEEAARSALGLVQLLEEHGIVAPATAERAEELVSGSSAFDREVSSVDLVIESAPEDMEFKKQLFSRLDAIAQPHATLASNTSGLSITEIASACQRPERVLTAHFWNPPHVMPLVELVRSPRTDTTVVENMRSLLRHCGKIPVVVRKDRPGQLGNRLQSALVREAVHIVAEGIADPEDVDLAARAGFGLRLPAYGIFEHQDMIGLDLGYAVNNYVAQDLYSERHAPPLYAEKVERGELGVRTGKGFYDWHQRDAMQVKARRDNWVRDFLKTPWFRRLRDGDNESS